MGGSKGAGGAIDPAILEEMENNKRMLEEFRRQQEEYKEKLA